MRLVLASASPRRAELLRAAGIAFDVVPAYIDERALANERPDDYVRRVAEQKASAVGQRMSGALVLGADTTVVVDDEMLGKPSNDRDATRMLRLLSGRTHQVFTAVAVCRGAILSAGVAPAAAKGSEPHLITELARTAVEFATLTADEIAWYVATGEPRDKAGGYAIQGYASRFVTRVDGSYANVVGLPVALVYEILKRLTTL
jgi:septum formation protein